MDAMDADPLSPINLPPPPGQGRVTDPTDNAGATDAAQPQAQQAPVQSAAMPVTATAAPDLASTIVDDGDLIEKEWVSRVKRIVEGSRGDPYKQSEQLAVLRADYMKKRYNKDIKLGK